LIRILIAAASPIVRAGVEALLPSESGISVVATTAGWQEAAAILADVRPDLLIVEVENELPPGLLQIAEDVPTIILAEDPDRRIAGEALRSGVRAVLSRRLGQAEIIGAIQAVSAGLIVVRPDDVRALLIRQRPLQMFEELTAREREVLGMIAEGLSNKAIAARLNISDHTVKFHVGSIMAKLNAGSRTEAVALGIRQGLVTL